MVNLDELSSKQALYTSHLTQAYGTSDPKYTQQIHGSGSRV